MSSEEIERKTSLIPEAAGTREKPGTKTTTIDASTQRKLSERANSLNESNPAINREFEVLFNNWSSGWFGEDVRYESRFVSGKN